MKKKILLFLITVVCAAALSVKGYALERKKLTVVTTIFPLYDFSREIGKDKVEIIKLLPPGVEAHAFEIRPRDIVTINKADIFVYTGEYMEPWALDLLKGLSNNNLAVVDASKGILPAGEKDPHIWLDMSYAQKMTQTIAEAFAKADPENKDYYLDNAKNYEIKLADIDARFKETFSMAKIKTIIYAGHFTFGYFAKRYGLTYDSPYSGFSPDAEPSPKNIKRIIEILKNTGSRYVYYEELIDPKIARIIASETGAKLELLSGAHNVSNEDLAAGVTFLSIMEDNLRKLKEGLQCK